TGAGPGPGAPTPPPAPRPNRRSGSRRRAAARRSRRRSPCRSSARPPRPERPPAGGPKALTTTNGPAPNAEPLPFMRLNGVEPSRVFPPTRPSTLRVYQFRHSREVGGHSRDSVTFGAQPSRAALRASVGRGTLRTSVRLDPHTANGGKRRERWLTWTSPRG